MKALIVFAVLLPLTMLSQTKATAKLKSATVFLDGAQLYHEASTTIKKGKQTVAIGKITEYLDPSTIQVKGEGAFTILSVDVKRNFDNQENSEAKVEKLNAKKEGLEKTQQALQDEYTVWVVSENLLMNNSRLAGEVNGLKVSELKEASSFFETRMRQIRKEKTRLENEFAVLEKKMNVLEQEIYSERTAPVEIFSEILIEVEAKSETKAKFYVNYLTPNALWAPYYDIRSAGIGSPIKLERKGKVTQTTGMDWNGIALTLSTNDPYQNTEEPVLTPWQIYYNNQPQRRPTPPRRTVQYSMAGQKIQGHVYDAETGEPIPFATVAVGGKALTTDFDGRFEFIYQNNMSYANISSVGYTNQGVSITQPYVRVFLQSNQQEISDVEVVSYEVDRSAMKYSSVEEVSISRAPGLFKGRKKSRRKYKSAARSAAAPPVKAYNPEVVAEVKSLRVEYAIQNKMDIPSDGAPHRVQITTESLTSEYEYHAVPKFDNGVYLVGMVTGWEKLNLLPGESNVYFDGTYIGQSYLNPNTTKDTLSLSLGKENKIQIERNKIDELSKRRTIGSKSKYTVGWEIKVKNNGGANIPVVIKDQVPFTADASIKIKYEEPAQAKVNLKTGIITWKLGLAELTKSPLKFSYEVEYNKDKRLILE